MDTIDLSYLSDKERRKIQAVLERDAQMQKKEEQRLERLKTKSDKTKNPVILKKIRMRSGQWFVELQSSSRFKRRGVDTVRSSIRMAKSRRGSRADVSTISPMISPCPTPAEPQTRLAPPPAPSLQPVIEQAQSENGEISFSTETEPLPSGAEPPPTVIVNSEKDPEPVEAKEDPPQQEPEEKPEETPMEEEKPEPVVPEEVESPPSPKTWGKLSLLSDMGIFGGSKANSVTFGEDVSTEVVSDVVAPPVEEKTDEEPETTPEDTATSVVVVTDEQVTAEVTVQQPAEENTAPAEAAIEAGVDSPSHVVTEAPAPSSLEDISGPPVAVEVQVTTPEGDGAAAEAPADAGISADNHFGDAEKWRRTASDRPSTARGRRVRLSKSRRKLAQVRYKDENEDEVAVAMDDGEKFKFKRR